MTRLRIITLALALSTTATLAYSRHHDQASVHAITGNDWPSICSSKTTNSFDRMYCQAYARGVADGFKLWQVGDLGSAQVCIPDTVSERQLIDVVVAYIRRNPANGHLRIAAVLGLAYLEAWPCK